MCMCMCVRVYACICVRVCVHDLYVQYVRFMCAWREHRDRGKES